MKYLRVCCSADKNFDCDKCEQRYARKSDLTKHMKQCGQTLCRVTNCGFSCSSPKDLQTHIDEVHTQNFTCQKEGCNFSGIKKTVVSHEKEHQRCKMARCGFLYDTVKELNIHEDIMCEEDNCLYVTCCKKALTQHRKEHKYKCNTCHFSASKKNEVTRHQEKEHPMSHCPTAQCKYKGSQEALDSHLARNPCEENGCGFTTCKPAALPVHTETEHPRPVFNCETRKCRMNSKLT